MFETETKELKISEEIKRKVEMFCRFAFVFYESLMVILHRFWYLKKRVTARRKRPFQQNGNTLRHWQSQ